MAKRRRERQKPKDEAQKVWDSLHDDLLAQVDSFKNGSRTITEDDAERVKHIMGEKVKTIMGLLEAEHEDEMSHRDAGFSEEEEEEQESFVDELDKQLVAAEDDKEQDAAENMEIGRERRPREESDNQAARKTRKEGLASTAGARSSK